MPTETILPYCRLRNKEDTDSRGRDPGTQLHASPINRTREKRKLRRMTLKRCILSAVTLLSAVALNLAVCGSSCRADTIWGSTTPSYIDSNDGTTLTVGVRFTPSVNGTITGIRFYKSANNTGSHTGAIYNNSGTIQGTAVTFSGETASGWQEQNFGTGISVTANTTYVAAVYMPVGHYSADLAYFATSNYISGYLTAPMDNPAGDRNGIYYAGSPLTFPTSTYNANHYWVDVKFTPSAPPFPPVNLAGIPCNAQVSLSWSATEDATSYSIYRGTSAGGESSTAIATGITSTSYTNTSLTNGTTYYYKIKAVNSFGSSGYSNETSGKPTSSAPSAPTGVAATYGNTQNTLSWSATSGALSYNVYKGTTSGGESGTPIATGLTSLTYTDQLLVNGTTYYYKIKAVNCIGNSSYSSEVNATPHSGSGTALTKRPNDGSGYWPDFSNTGYTHAPGYTALTDYQAGMSATTGLTVDAAAGTVFNHIRFLGKISIASNAGDNLVFNGCLFEGTFPQDNLIQVYCNSHCTFNYCTFKPYGISTPPGNAGTSSTNCDTGSDTASDGTPFASSYQSLSGNVNTPTGQLGTFVTTMDHCDVWGNAGIQLGEGTSATNPAIYNFCYIHDQADPWGYTWSTSGIAGTNYHNDGIGPDSVGGVGHGFITVRNCTIASMGNTNGLALQGSTGYSYIVFQGNYVSGWGIAISIGTSGANPDTNCTFTDNIFSGEVPCVNNAQYIHHRPVDASGNSTINGGGACAANYIPSTGADAGYLLPPGQGNVWRRNRFQTFAGDPYSACSGYTNGNYWWPSDNTYHSADYTGN